MARWSGDTVTPRGRYGLPSNLVAAHQRERILAAAIELVAKRGYRGTSIEHMVKTARVGYAAFYELFKDKEDCFCAAFDQIVADAREALAASMSSELPWPEQVCATLDLLLGLIAAEPFAARIVLVEAQNAGGAPFDRYESLLDDVGAQLRSGRRHGRESSGFPPTLEETIVAGVTWLLHRQAVTGELGEVEGMFGELALIVLEPYVGRREAVALIAAHSESRERD